jgi:hypothetical protein
LSICLARPRKAGPGVRGSLKATKLQLGKLSEDIQSTIEYLQERIASELGAEIME